MNIFKERFPAVYDKMMNGTDSRTIEIMEAKQGGKVPAVITEGKRFFVHSKFDPVKEAKRFINEIDTDGYDLFIVFGFGFAYHIEELMRGMPDKSLVLVIEKSPLMLKMALENRDLSRILEDGRLIVLIDPGEEMISDALKGKSSRRASLLLHRGSFQIERNYYTNMQEIARSYLSTKEVNIATLAKFEKIWAGNIARNIGIFIRSPGVNIFFDKLKGIPAIIVAAGPSLHQSIDFIKKHRARAVIIAVDTSYKILLKSGIEPHFCIVVDPQVVNARYFEGSGMTRTILIADPMVHPSVFRFFKGPVALTGVAFKLLHWIDSFFGHKGEITHGGSVSTNACDFALRTGASPVILMGQDLAFTGGYAHARGSYLDEQVYLRTRRLYSAEMFNRFQLTALPKISVKGIRSETVNTNQKMMIFLSWFEKRNDENIINATYDGARIPGIQHASADELTLPDPGMDIAAFVDELYRAADIESGAAGTRRVLGARINTIQKEINSLIPLLGRAVEFSDALYSLMRDKKRDQRRLDYLLGKLSETDRIVESKRHAKDMISFTVQRVVHTITEGYDIDEADSLLTEQERVVKRSQYLYRGLLEGAKFNSKILKKMASVLDAGD
ncbi:MAG: hypothetical protein A2W19_17070 [Spirochaetes bacterium RBG_16_49_21]|nr:MAG: hypothetical protein A2W19_17070 [Spirochaetes bacterium RBG_16_49_21]